MNDDDELCGHPGPGGANCTKPRGHEDEEHVWSVVLPPDVAKVVERNIIMMEDARDRAIRAARSATRWRYFFMGATALYVVLAIWRALNPY